jgi:flagellar hook-length control protein FliK
MQSLSEQLKKMTAVAAQAGTADTTTAQGGDESQLKAASEASIQDIEAAVSALGGKLESVRTQGKDAQANPAKGQLNALGGAEYLSALQGGKQAATGGAKASALKGGTEIGGIGEAKLAKAKIAEAKLTGFDSSLVDAPAITQTTVAKPALQVLPGGLSSGTKPESGHLQGGLRLSKDEPQAGPNDSVFIGATPLSAIKTSDQLGAVPPQTLTGHVVPGAMQRDRLTSESVRNMANSITGMTAAGGGEMRIKMNPGNLGELMIHVSTNGKDVGLKVQADNAGSKKIIEDSLGALRDSLASQSLALGRVDVTLATTSSQSSDFGSNSQTPNQQQQAAMSNFDGQTPNQGRFTENSGNEDRSSSGASRSRIAAMASAGVASRPSASRNADASRLDVMA